MNKLIEFKHTSNGYDYDNEKICNDEMFCAGCKLLIKDRFFLKAADRCWHVACLKCWICQVELQSERSCFTRDGFVYCREDYKRLFGKKSCIRCGIKITNDELVMRVRDLVFHVPCFCCVQCGRLLNTGEYFGLKGLLPFCQDDLLKNPLSIASPPSSVSGMIPNNQDESPSQSFPSNNSIQSNNGPQSNLMPPVSSSGPPNFPVSAAGPPPNGTNPSGVPLPSPHPFLFHPLSRLNNFYQPPHEAHNFHSIIPKVRGKKKRKESIYETGDEFCLGNPTRQKRMRTSFKHHQLRAMKSYFSLNHNPDAKDLKSLSEKTGLSKRVLQVWFQNARAKYRRNVSRTDGVNSHESFKDTKSLTGDSEQGGTFSKDGDGNDSSGNNENEDMMYLVEDDEDDEEDGDEDGENTNIMMDLSETRQETGGSSVVGTEGTGDKHINCLSNYMSHYSPTSSSTSADHLTGLFNSTFHPHHPHHHHQHSFSDSNNNITSTATTITSKNASTTDFHSLVHELEPSVTNNTPAIFASL